MYKFKEQYRDAKVSIPSIRLVITSDNVAKYAELMHNKNLQHMIELIEVKESKKIGKVEKDVPTSSPSIKNED
jgi:hypothetical protein